MNSPEKLKETQLPPKEAFILDLMKVLVTRNMHMREKFGKRSK